MKVAFYTNKPKLAGEMAEVIRLFYGEIIFAINQEPLEGADISLHQQILCNKDSWFFTLETGAIKEERQEPFPQGLPPGKEELIQKRYEKRYAKQLLYDVLKKISGKVLPWGSLTGVRPTRLVYEEMAAGEGLAKAVEKVEKNFDLQPDKAALLYNVVAFQQTMLLPSEKEVSIYIGIPFCTTRCSYCTFSAGEIGDGKLTAPYVKALLFEMEETKKIIDKLNLSLRSIYMGGGTPTALASNQLKQILENMNRLFPKVKEVTCEAGRPDTIDEEKLLLLKQAGVDRISINPQTMKEETLRIIGRNHTPQDTLEAYALARSLGFKHINMDIIAGLPKESLKDFENTLGQVLALKPQSLTVHSLSLKRGSKLWDVRSSLNTADYTAQMISLAREGAKNQGLLPYYLYRQKYMSENQENVGYAMAGYGCQYNVDMMEETTHVFAMGAGAISKRIDLDQGRIERAPNVSDIETYINRVEEMVQRKKVLWGLL